MSDHSSNRLAVDQPARPANTQPLVDSDPATALLPSLDAGITLLDIDGGRGVSVVQSLVLDHLLTHDGPAFWVDANGHATTTTLARLAPSQRLLDRIHVARGFTAYQHYGAVCDLPAAVTRSVRDSTVDPWQQSPRRDESGPQTPSLVVAPAVDAQYRAADALADTHAETLQARTLARLRRYAEGYDAPVLLTRSEADTVSEPVVAAADHRLECEQTEMGPRFIGDEFETLVYPVDGGSYQTTLAYWQHLLTTRAEQVGLDPVPTERCPGGSEPSRAAAPLLDAWTAAGAGGN